MVVAEPSRLTCQWHGASVILHSCWPPPTAPRRTGLDSRARRQGRFALAVRRYPLMVVAEPSRLTCQWHGSQCDSAIHVGLPPTAPRRTFSTHVPDVRTCHWHVSPRKLTIPKRVGANSQCEAPFTLAPTNSPKTCETTGPLRTGCSSLPLMVIAEPSRLTCQWHGASAIAPFMLAPHQQPQGGRDWGRQGRFALAAGRYH